MVLTYRNRNTDMTRECISSTLIQEICFYLSLLASALSELQWLVQSFREPPVLSLHLKQLLQCTRSCTCTPSSIFFLMEDHDRNISTGVRNITNPRFADEIAAVAEEEQELKALVESLDKTCTRYKMEISAEKTKLMTNSANDIQRKIKVKGQKLGTV